MAKIEEVLLTDIAHLSDLKTSATGDLDLLSGIANLKNSLYHRLVTEKGSLIHRPDYGVGMKQFQGAPNTLANQRQIALRINEQFALDPRVDSVEGVRVLSDDDRPEMLTVVVRVKIVGFGDAELKFIPFGEVV